MTPRRMRKVQQAKAAPTVVIQSPDRLTCETGEHVKRLAQAAFPGRRVIVLSGGMTAVTP